MLSTIWKDIVRVRIVLKTRIGLDACGVSSNTGFQYNRLVQYLSILYITLYNNLLILCGQFLLVEQTGENHDLSQVTDKLYHIVLYREQLAMSGV